jgi:hypothetical protein
MEQLILKREAHYNNLHQTLDTIFCVCYYAGRLLVGFHNFKPDLAGNNNYPGQNVGKAIKRSSPQMR